MSTQEYNAFRDLLRRKAYDKAVDFAEHRILDASVPNAFWQTQLALALAQAGRAVEAVRAAENALDIDPDNAYALRARAAALYAGGQYEDALADYREIERDSRLRGRARVDILRCLHRLRRWSDILECLERWALPEIEAVPWRAYALAGLDQTDAALEACRRWLAVKPDQPRALWLLTTLEIEQEGLESVLKRMGRLARIPTRPVIYREIYASLCRKAGRTQQALEVYAKASDNDADAPRLRRKQLFALAKSGKETEAVPLMEELLRQAPDDFYMHSAYTAACRRAGLLERAADFYQSLLTEHPEQKKVYGWLHRVNKQLETAGQSSVSDD